MGSSDRRSSVRVRGVGSTGRPSCQLTRRFTRGCVLVALSLCAACARPAPESTGDAQFGQKLAELEGRVAALEARANPELGRSAEWKEYDQVGMEAFWQRRFDAEARDEAWAALVERSVASEVEKDEGVAIRSLACRKTLCRLEVACSVDPDCNPRVGGRIPSGGPKLGAVFGEPRLDAAGLATKLVFLFREGRSMVPEGAAP